MKPARDSFFVGWRDATFVGRRRLLAASLVLIGAGAAGASWRGRMLEPPGPGVWRQSDIADWTGALGATPYPHLRLQRADGAPQTAFLATAGKQRVILPAGMAGTVTVRASAIRRGDHLMLAVVDGADWIRPAGAAAIAAWPEAPLGAATMVGEILDAKCWFGAMRPGYGKTHKACAALCARGGLPLAFCDAGACGDALSAPLFLDSDGAPHGRDILPLVADPVVATGALVRVGDVTQFRVARRDIRRL